MPPVVKTFVQKIIKKHKLKRDKYYKNNKNPYEQRWGTISEEELLLLENWAHKVERGEYGIRIGNPCPVSWFRALNDFFTEIDKKYPDFMIIKVKMRFGGIVIELNGIDVKARDAIKILQFEMFDKNLVY